MKVAILAGGKGLRFGEETFHRPKPMIEVGGFPIIWHIMMHYHTSQFSDFVVALGYKGDIIRRWFQDQAPRNLSLEAINPVLSSFDPSMPDWSVTLADTGLETQTGGRVKALKPYLGDEPFVLAWGDGVSNVDLPALKAFHESHGKLATMLVVRPPARFGHVAMDGDQIVHFQEKPAGGEGWINGGVFILQPEVFHYIQGPATHFEREPLETLASEGQLMAYRHHGFWQCMDNGYDRQTLEEFWAAGNRPWATWEKGECAFL